MKLKQEIRDRTGIVASAGIAPNKFLAKLASDLEKPDGLTIIEEDRVQEVLSPLPVSKIWGVGKKSNQVLAEMGIVRIGQLLQADYRQLERRLGNSMARQLYNLSRGIDDRPVAPREPAKSIGNEITFPEDIQGQEAAEQVLLELSVKVGWRLRQAGVRAKTVHIKVRKHDFTTFSRQKQLVEMSGFDNDIYRAARELFRELGIFYGIRLLGVSASGFDAHEEMSLFAGDNEKQEKLYNAIDSINRRFGSLGITRANLLR